MHQSHFFKELAVAALLCSCGWVLAGCDPNTADAGSGGESDGRDATLVDPVLTTWPTDEQTGMIRQVTKYVQATEKNPSLLLMSELPGSQLPPWDIDLIGIKRVSVSEVEALIDSGRWALVDARKDQDVLEKGTIPGAYHLEYKYEGAEYDGETRLARARIDALLAEYDGVILFCNGPKCPRSFNSCLHVAQGLGVPGSRVRWFRTGVPSWTRSPLIPIANEVEIKPDTNNRQE